MQEINTVKAVENPFEFTYERAIAVNKRADRLSDLNVANAGDPSWPWELTIEIVADLRQYARVLQEDFDFHWQALKQSEASALSGLDDTDLLTIE